jgi:cyclic lactone autoinducer peptide
MSKKNYIIKHLDNIIASCAFKLSRLSANQVCDWFMYQPELPEHVKKLHKK